MIPGFALEYKPLNPNAQGLDMKMLQFDSFQLNAHAHAVTQTRGGFLLRGSQVYLDLPIRARSYYRHGWQSWSLTAWTDPTITLPVQKPYRMHPLQTDPVYARHLVPNGSWVGAVELEDGQVALLGALALESHVALHDHELHGWGEAGELDWFVSVGPEETVFAQYAEQLAGRLGRAPEKQTPRVWCSWYSLYNAIDESILQHIFAELEDLPFDVLQVDDGWQTSVGDWEPNEKFPSGMKALAECIRATGRTPGLWLAPLLVVPSSNLFKERNDWLLRNSEGRLVEAGFLWGAPLYALDTSNLEVLDWLQALMRKVRAWGYDYLKLDFLYAGALPGKRQKDMPREAAYRQGLQALRSGLATDAYLLTCGAPILPSLGLCDALRIGPDVSGEWEPYRDSALLQNPSTPGVKNAIRTTVNRLWLRPLITLDPDVAYFSTQRNSLSQAHKHLLQDLALVCGFKATSDIPDWWTAQERHELQAFLEAKPVIQRTGRYSFRLDEREVDFKPAMSTSGPLSGIHALLSAAIGWIGNQTWALRLLDRLGKRGLETMKREL